AQFDAFRHLTEAVLPPLTQAHQADPTDVAVMLTLAHWRRVRADLGGEARDAQELLRLTEQARRLDPQGAGGWRAEWERALGKRLPPGRDFAASLKPVLEALVERDPAEAARLHYPLGPGRFRRLGAVGRGGH